MTPARTTSDPAPARRARRFQRVRDAHQTEVAEDYVELIADLIEEKGEARVVDLAECLGVTKPTVNNAPYRAIFLTDKGRELAAAARARHRGVREFLLALGVDAETADEDAEGIEHHVSDATLEAFRKHLSKLRRSR